jgi:hypothetical protein
MEWIDSFIAHGDPAPALPRGKLRQGLPAARATSPNRESRGPDTTAGRQCWKRGGPAGAAKCSLERLRDACFKEFAKLGRRLELRDGI